MSRLVQKEKEKKWEKASRGRRCLGPTEEGKEKRKSTSTRGIDLTGVEEGREGKEKGLSETRWNFSFCEKGGKKKGMACPMPSVNAGKEKEGKGDQSQPFQGRKKEKRPKAPSRQLFY